MAKYRMASRVEVVRGKTITRRLNLGGYFQDTDAKWWFWSEQKGWLRANTAGRAFRWHLALDLFARFGFGDPWSRPGVPMARVDAAVGLARAA